ncbi:stomatin-like protein [Pseudidiomarina terrestris]|uniref:Paraslipin n=1 Tax=Pseudidiomarina terrestris TaxID=2820060 RepID=A0AAW7QX95_9GAMM|nr:MULTISPECIES: stomatin-like protein [unclassified Pseudidiomarina]MDN7123684.1 paraslipin [Pseudidiomarina sp. 1APP75-32.1]MDN7126526.1 paraslipin [Pseudidiomarina sp. 1APR75-33.1]MDN7128592.1 paraslipin [Pseudidiomarina sp. 1APR75-15]MDN7135149.1 paraslipin [Pseudidiomarina sp. 1ASP75-5]MDN7137820.1 paraslipin [Pseudidiomarina sp. 1ASP75-14]
MFELNVGTVLALGFAVAVIIIILKTARIVPQRSNYVIERLGRYNRTLESGFHLLIPFVDKVAYQHVLKEEVIDVERQACVTRDNIQVGINGVLYIQVVDAHKASYGINDYRYAASQLAQTTMRSVIGQTDLDKTFEERARINEIVVQALDEAAAPWGIKVLRYEISDIELPMSIKDALEQQMRAERERRAAIAKSEGERQAMINVSEGHKQEVINLSEAEKQKQINEAEGRAKEIELIAIATAEGLRKIASATQEPGGESAVSLRVAEQYVKEFGNLAKETNTLILPAQLADIGGAVAGLTEVLKVKPSQQ